MWNKWKAFKEDLEWRILIWLKNIIGWKAALWFWYHIGWATLIWIKIIVIIILLVIVLKNVPGNDLLINHPLACRLLIGLIMTIILGFPISEVLHEIVLQILSIIGFTLFVNYFISPLYWVLYEVYDKIKEQLLFYIDIFTFVYLPQIVWPHACPLESF